MDWQLLETFNEYTGDVALFLYKDRSGVQAVTRGHSNEFPYAEGWFELDYSDKGLLGADSYSHWMPLPDLPSEIKE